ncbi:MAG: serine/threonine-protein phosphatase [Eubacterium sp.]|nr:serine/threonine-protein phosphatase [Eubacterium sp.]
MTFYSMAINHFILLSGNDAEAAESLISEALIPEDLTALLPAAGALAAVILLALCLFLFFRIRRKQKREAKNMAAGNLPEIAPIGDVMVGKLHEQGAREGQQDCFGVSDQSLMRDRGLLAVVADGMGGLSDGDKVSAAAVSAVLDGFALYQGKCTQEQQLLMLARQAVEAVDELLGPSGYNKSGSTLVMGLIHDSAFSFLSIGDSRICLYRHGLLMQLNREHIFRNQLALDAINGNLPLQDAYTDSRGSGLTSFLGMGTLEHIDMPASPVRLIPGDKLLLMSDGVYNALSEEELISSLNGSPEDVVSGLRQAILEKGFTNQDNYTAVILECMPANGTGQAKKEQE